MAIASFNNIGEDKMTGEYVISDEPTGNDVVRLCQNLSVILYGNCSSPMVG
jgi:hypothetical protein